MVHADGFTGFNGLFGADRASEQACMVHVRRKFVDIYEGQGSAITEETIRRIAALYGVEKAVRYKPVGMSKCRMYLPVTCPITSANSSEFGSRPCFSTIFIAAIIATTSRSV